MDFPLHFYARMVAGLLGLVSPVAAWSQTAPGQAAPTFTLEPGNICSLNWNRVNGRVTVVQLSADLVSWMNAPLVDLGGGVAVPPYKITGAGKRFFVRLRYTIDTDQVAGAEGDLDGDGISNGIEVTISGTDPFIFNTLADVDTDGLPDVWENYYWGNLTAQNGVGDADGDGLTNREEYEMSLNPTLPESSTGVQRTDYVYDLTGRLTSAAAPTGGPPKTPNFFSPDEEGNLLSAP